MAAPKKAKVLIKWRFPVFREMRTSPEMMAELARRAERIAAAAGPGYEAGAPRVTGGKVRGRVSVKTATTTARRREAKDHSLLRALNAGKG